MRKEKPSVLYLSYDGLTDPLGQSQILPYLIGLSSENDISIISFEKPERFKEGERKVQGLLTHNISWFPLSYHKFPPVLSTVYDLYVLNKLSDRLHKEKMFSIVHCRSYLTALIGVRMKRKVNTKFIFDMRGFWADERIEGGIWNISNPLFKSIYKFFKKKEKTFLSEADHVITLTESAKHEIEVWSTSSKPITVIPTCVDLDFFKSQVSDQKQKALQSDLGVANDAPILLYLGSWGTWYQTDEMLSYYQQLKNEVPNLVFLIISQDQVQLPIGIKDVIVRKASREDVPNYISLSWASIFFIKPTFSKKASSATKMAEILSLGVPVFSNGGWGDMDRYAKEFRNLVLKEDPNAFEILKSWVLNREKRNPDNLNGLSLSYGIDQYKKVYTSLLDEKDSSF